MDELLERLEDKDECFVLLVGYQGLHRDLRMVFLVHTDYER